MTSSRAIFIMALVTDIHPFTDGNGRIARILMNVELFARGLATVIIPTVYREDYLLTLRAFTRRHRPQPMVDMLIKAQRFSRLDYSSYPAILKVLQSHHWFAESKEARILENSPGNS